MKSSIPEQYVCFYLSKAFNDIQYQKQFDWLGKRSLDIYIPSLKLAIEYDGVYYHSDRQIIDFEKTKLCRRNGVKVFRIREQDHDLLEDENLRNTKDTVIYFFKRNYSNIDVVIGLLCSLINKKFKMTIHVDVNIERDKKDILSYVQEKYHKKTIAYVWPESKDYWDETVNTRSVFDVFYTDNNCYFLKCPHCGTLFKFHMRYFHDRKSLIPCECEYAGIKQKLAEIVDGCINCDIPISFDNSLWSRRLYDEIESKIHFNSSRLSKKEAELYKKSGFESPYLDYYLSKYI